RASVGCPDGVGDKLSCPARRSSDLRCQIAAITVLTRVSATTGATDMRNTGDSPVPATSAPAATAATAAEPTTAPRAATLPKREGCRTIGETGACRYQRNPQSA